MSNEEIDDHEHAMKEKTTHRRKHWFNFEIDNIFYFPSQNYNLWKTCFLKIWTFLQII
jgi:hypothetical protein